MGTSPGSAEKWDLGCRICGETEATCSCRTPRQSTLRKSGGGPQARRSTNTSSSSSSSSSAQPVARVTRSSRGALRPQPSARRQLFPSPAPSQKPSTSSAPSQLKPLTRASARSSGTVEEKKSDEQDESEEEEGSTKESGQEEERGGLSGEHKCSVCKKGFSSKFKLVRHGLIHSERRAFSCALCQKTFHRKDHLKNHAKVHSPFKSRYKCARSGCGKEYCSALSLRKHEAGHRAEEGCLDCGVCGRSFSSKEEIVFHLKVHAGSRTVKSAADKKHRCEVCGRRFFTGKDVRRHLVVHTGRRDFLCQACPQRFGRKDHLVRHMAKSHLGGAGATGATASATRAVTEIITEQRAHHLLQGAEEIPQDLEESEDTCLLSLLDGDVLARLLKAEDQDSGPSGTGSSRGAPLPAFKQAFTPPPS